LQRIESYREFWPYYLREHSEPACRNLHFVGTGLTLLAFVLAILVNPWFLLAAPVLGYGFAWYSHFKFEKNKPATFTYPLWSLVSDYRMFFAWIFGTLPRHLREADVKE
jgi:hypothetical protein